MKGLIDIYQRAKQAKVGESCICAGCGEEFVKTSYQQAFCKTKRGTVCKDKYWNTVTPEKRNNTTRISPASARFKQRNPRRTSEGYAIRNGVAYDEFDNPVYNVDPNEDDYDDAECGDHEFAD